MQQRLLLLSASLLVAAGCATFSSLGSRPLAENQTLADHLLVDLSHVYVTSADGPSTRIVRVSKEREGPPVVLATVPGKIADTALDGDFVYWVVDHPDAAEPVATIQKAPKGAAGPITTVVRSPNRVTSLAFDAMHLYFTQAGNPNDPNPFRSPGVLRLMLLGDASPANVVTAQRGVPSSLAMNGTHVFWVNHRAGEDVTIMSLAKAGGEPAALATVQDIITGNAAPALVADDRNVYFLTANSLMQVPVQGGKTTELAHVRMGDSAHLVFDYTSLYFVAEQGLMRMPLAGGAAVVVSAQRATDIATDDRAVYWISGANVMYFLK